MSKERSCSCSGNCLNKNCDCFNRGGYCSDSCKCESCENRREFEKFRIKIIEKILEENPMYFSSSDDFTYEEKDSVISFTKLEKPISKKKFNIKRKEKQNFSKFGKLALNETVNLINAAVIESVKNCEDVDKLLEETEEILVTQFDFLVDLVSKSND